MNFKQQKVVIVKDDMGNAIRVSKNNAEYAHVRLSQTKSWLSAMGWFTKRDITTLIHGKTEDLQKSGIGRMKKLPGNIRIVEQLTPFSESNPDRDVKHAGQTGVVCCQDGQPIYRKTFYDATAQLEDELVAHTNGDAIREANSGTLEDLKRSKVTVSEESMTDDEETEDVDENQVDLEDAIAEVEAEAKESNDPEEEEEVIINEVKDDEEIEVEEKEEDVEVEENVFKL